MKKQIGEVVDFLEGRIQELINSHGNLKEELTKTRNVLEQQERKNQEINLELEELHKKYNMLKNANALLGSDEHKKETKHKINALIREIDVCIAQLS